MRFKRHIEIERGLKAIDVIPFINMLLLLLLFFMLTSSFVIEPGITVALPRALTSEVLKYENIEIVVSGDNATYLNGRLVTLEEIKNFLKQVPKRNRAVIIKADKGVTLGSVVGIWDLCRQQGMVQVSIATQQ
jgi:biopolymer transport protein ExbD